MKTDTTKESASEDFKLSFDPWQNVTASGSDTPACPSRKLARFGLKMTSFTPIGGVAQDMSD